MKKILTIAVILLLVVLGLAWVNNSKRNMAGNIRRLTADASETINETAEKIKEGAVEVKEQAAEGLARVTEPQDAMEEPATEIDPATVETETVDIEVAENEIQEDIDVAKVELDESSQKARADIDQLLTENERKKLEQAQQINGSSSPEKVVISKVGNEEITLVPVTKSAEQAASPVMYNDKMKDSDLTLEKDVIDTSSESASIQKKSDAASLNPAVVRAPKPDASSSWISSAQPTKVVINYAKGATGVSPAAKEGLTEIIKAVKAQPLRTIRIIGHSDNSGSIMDQRRASYLRTEEVVAYLESRGVDPASIHYDHMGYKMPLMVAGTDAAQARNRRVEVYLRQN